MLGCELRHFQRGDDGALRIAEHVDVVPGGDLLQDRVVQSGYALRHRRVQSQALDPGNRV
jgi:hypothetical protein